MPPPRPARPLDGSWCQIARSCQHCSNRAMDLLDELRTLVVRHAGGGPQQKIQVLDGISITRVDEPTPPIGAMAEPSLAVVGQGVKRTVLNGVPHDYRAGQYLVVS